MGYQEQRWVVGREYSDDKLCRQWVKFELLAGPLSRQKWGLETGVWETRDGRLRVEVRNRKCLG